MKLMNFRRFDAVYQAQGKTGLTRGNKLEEAVWNEFTTLPARLNQTAKAIVANLDDETPLIDADDVGGIEEAEEGRILTRAHLVRERSRKLVEAKKAEFFRSTGNAVRRAVSTSRRHMGIGGMALSKFIMVFLSTNSFLERRPSWQTFICSVPTAIE
jgi:hypothetical protein